MTCINCGAEGEGKFCSNCAQPLHVKRITFKEGWHDFWARIYGFDGMFPRTFKDLTLRPGFASREFIRGNRARYYGPVGYYFLMITLFLLLLSMIGLDYNDYLAAKQNFVSDEQRDDKLVKDSRQLVVDNVKIVLFFIPPFIAFASRYIFFRKQGMNFIEHSVPIFYMMGHFFWFQMIDALVFRYMGYSMGAAWIFLFTAFYLAFGYTGFITTQPKWKTFLKGLGVYVVGFLLFGFAIVIIMLIVIFIMAFVDPAYFESIRPSKNR